jgi:hypothetical protein
MDEKQKKMKRMATWTIAIFATVFAVFMALFWLVTYPTRTGSVLQSVGAALGAGWPIFVLTAVLCVAANFGYRAYINRK